MYSLCIIKKVNPGRRCITYTMILRSGGSGPRVMDVGVVELGVAHKYVSVYRVRGWSARSRKAV